MARGKARNKKKVLELLKPFFQLGCSVTKACAYAGIAESTVRTWIDADDDLRAQVVVWQNELSAVARKNLAVALRTGNISVSSEWLNKKERDEFAGRTELTGADGSPLGGLSAEDKEAINKLHDILQQQST